MPTKELPPVPAHLKDNPTGLLYRLNAFANELNLRRGGTPWHPAMLSEDKPISLLAIDCVALARAYLDALETQVSEGKYR